MDEVVFSGKVLHGSSPAEGEVQRKDLQTDSFDQGQCRTGNLTRRRSLLIKAFSLHIAGWPAHDNA